MADDIKRLLIRLGISTQDWETAVKRIKADLDQMNRKALADSAAKVSASQRELAAEQRKQDAVRSQLKDIDEQITKVKLLMNLRAKDPDAVANLIAQEKLLLAVKQQQFNVMAQSPKFRDTDLSKIKEEIQLEQSRLRLRQAQMTLTEFTALPLAPVRPEADPNRQARLSSQLSSAEARGQLAEIRESQEERQRLMEKGDVTAKQFIKDNEQLETKAHQLRLEQIKEQMTARSEQLSRDLAGNKVSIDEELVRTKIIKAETEVRIAEENALYQARLRSARATALGEEEGGIKRFGGAALGMFTGGLGPEMMAAVTAGELLNKVLEKIGEHVREIFVGGGREQMLTEQFEKLARRDGVDANEILEKMRTNTHGLVSDFQLMQISSNFMRSGVKASSDQIAEMAKYTVALSRSTQASSISGGGGGRVLGPEQSIQSLIQASLTGRTMQLGRAVGIPSRELMLQGLPQTIDETTRKSLEFNKTLEAMRDQFKQIGEPQLTYAERMRQAEVATANFYGAVAIGMGHSQAFRDLLEELGSILGDVSARSEHAGLSLGKGLGDSFIVITPLIQLLEESFKALWDLLGLVPKSIDAVTGAIDELFKLFGYDTQLKGSISTFFSLHGILGMLAVTLTMATMGMREFGNGIQLVGALLEALGEHSVAKATKALDEWKKRHDQIVKETAEQLGKEVKYIQEGGTTAPTPPPAGEAGPTEQSIAAAQRIAKLQLQIKRAAAKESFDLTKESLQQEQSITQEAYNAGLMSLENYNNRTRAIRQQQHAARLAEIRSDERAALEEIDIEQKARLGTFGVQIGEALKENTPEGNKRVGELQKEQTSASQEFNLQRTIARQKARQQETAEDISMQRQEFAAQTKNEMDALAARRQYVAELTTIEKAGHDARVALIEDEFKTGELNATDYLTFRRNFIQEEYEIEVKAAHERAAATADSYKAQAQLQVDLVQAQINREKQVTELQRKENDIRNQYAENRYNTEKGLLESALTLTPQTGQRSPMGDRTQVINSLLNASSDYASNLQKQLDTIVKQGGEFGNDWVKVKTQMYGALQYQIQMREELIKSRDVMIPIAGIFGSISSSFGGFNQTLGGTFSRASSVLESFGTYRTQIQARRDTLGPQAVGGMTGNVIHDIGHGIRGLLHRGPSLTRPMSDEERRAAVVDKFSQSLISSQQGTIKFTSALNFASDTINSVYNKAANTISGFSDALSASITTLNQNFQTTQYGPTLENAGGPAREGTQLSTEVSSQLNDMVNSAAAAVKSLDDLSGSASNASDTLGKPGGGDNSSDDTTTGKLSGFKEALSAGMSAVSGTMSAIQGAHTAGGGALSVGMQGAAIGAEFGGPWGAAIGGAAGAITGGVIGNKRAQLQANLAELDASIKSITESLQNGSTKMGDAIKQLQSMRATAVSTLGGTKKGQKQLPAVLQALDAQIEQLQEQQRQTLEDMHTQLKNMAQDPALADYLNSLESIIQKYKEFSSAAAGNAQEVALANQYLVESLQQYLRTEQKDLVSSQMQAVQNAIQLLDLEKQRYDLIQQTNQQIFDIMGQGNLVATRTQAQQHAEQISQIEKQRDEQLHQLDMEISTAQTRFNIEQQIFGLSSNRVTLETQLVSLQNQQTTFDMQRVSALQLLVSKLSNVNLSQATNIDALFQLLGLPVPTGTETATTQAAMPRYRAAVFTGSISGSDSHSVWKFIGYDGSNDIYERTNGSAAYAVVGPGIFYSHPGIYPGNINNTMAGASTATGTTGGTPTTSTTTSGDTTATTIATGTTTSALTYQQRASSAFTAAGISVPGAGVTTVNAESLKMSNAVTIHTMETNRINAQMAVVKMQKDASSSDLARIKELRGLLADIKNAGGTATTLENMLSSSYGLAGRQGYSGFNRSDL